MRWNDREPGTTRIKWCRFLLFPQCVVTNGKTSWRWLEWASWEEEWHVGPRFKFWVPTKWINQ